MWLTRTRKNKAGGYTISKWHSTKSHHPASYHINESIRKGDWREVVTNPLVLLSFVVTSPRLLNDNGTALHPHILLPNQKATNNFLDQHGAFGQKFVSLFLQLNVLLILSINTNKLSDTTESCQSKKTGYQSSQRYCQSRQRDNQSHHIYSPKNKIENLQQINKI